MISSKIYTKYNAAPKGVALLFSTLCKGLLVLGVFLFSSCENDMKKVDELTNRKVLPELEMDGMVMEYSENGQINIKVEATLAEIFSGRKEHYNFPKGVKLTTYGELEDGTRGESSTMKADSAVYFKGDHLEAYGNVELTGKDGVILQTNFINWDEKNRWVSTTDTVYIIENGFTKMSMGLEAKDDFTYTKFINLTGTISVDAKKDSD